MKPIKIAAAVLNQTPLDWDGNLQRTLEAMDHARREDVRLLCLPELCISGYGCEDSFFCSTVQQISQTLLMEIAEKSQGLVVAVGLPLWHAGNLYNMAALIADGKLAGLVGKQNLAREGIHYETRWFSPWPAGLVSHTQISGVDYPIGDLVFEVGGMRLGFEICRDAWVAQRPGSSLARESVDVILNPSASHFAFGKHATRQRFVLEGSRAFHVGYIYTNLLGNEAGRAIYDGDTMIASCGKLLAKGDRFSFGDSRMVSAVLDIEEARMLRAQWSDAAPSDPTSDRVVQVPFVFEPTAVELTHPCQADWETGESLRLEEFTRAVALGLFDYLRKSHSKGFVVSLSGGADSTATSLLCRISIELAMADLGADGLHQRLKHIDGIKECQTASQFARRLITCVYQATENSSKTTRDSAQCVADEIGARFLEFDISGVVDQYLNIATESLGHEFNWQDHDQVLQNIQARTRAPLAWLVANLDDALLLSTSNRSEVAVGYATMDGDTAGGLCPIAGIDKVFLRNWLLWLESNGYAGGGPLPYLDIVNCQTPTAELRPPEANQTDEDDLMPYVVLDAIERAAIRDKRSPVEVFIEVTAQFSQEYGSSQLAHWVRRFFRLWAQNQWKRERFAPSFHVDDENLDPKTWCRFPILSGGFVWELRELDAFLKENT